MDKLSTLHLVHDRPRQRLHERFRVPDVVNRTLVLRKNANKLPTSAALADGNQSEEGDEDDDSRRGASSP